MMCEPKHPRGIGFKDLRFFNDALLAKQGWDMIHPLYEGVYMESQAYF